MAVIIRPRPRWWTLLPFALVLLLGGEGSLPRPPQARALPAPPVILTLSGSDRLDVAGRAVMIFGAVLGQPGPVGEVEVSGAGRTFVKLVR